MRFFERAREWLKNRTEVLQQLRRENLNHSLSDKRRCDCFRVFRGAMSIPRPSKFGGGRSSSIGSG
jgi:hypothetical protein